MNQKQYSEDVLSQKIFWHNKLSADIPETNFPLDYTRPLKYFSQDNSFSFRLSDNLSQAIIKLARGSSFSTYWILLSAFNILLQRYTSNDDVVVGIPRYGKIQSERSNSILPLRVEVAPQISFQDFLFQVKGEIINIYNHQNCNLDEIIQLLKIPISSNRSSIFDIVVLLENIHDSINLEQINNDITISFLIKNRVIFGTIKYKENLFNSESIELIGNCYSDLLETLIKNIEIKISEINFLPDQEQHKLLKEFNNNTQEYPVTQTINQLFEQQVLKSLHNIAAVHQGAQLTYQQLNKKANQIARLLRKLGVKKGDFVGIFKDRDLNFLLAVLAIHKAGGAYVPIDSNYPVDRITYMLSNSEVKYLFTDDLSLSILEEAIPSCQQLSSVICFGNIISELNSLGDRVKIKIAQESDFSSLSPENLEPINDAVDPAYLLYTSGSTGLPKGAIVRHDGAINHIYAQFDQLDLNDEFTFLQSAPSSTDISVWQFLAPLLIGGKTVIADLETVAMGEKLFDVIKSEKITVVELVPALFKVLFDYAWQLSIQERALPNLKWMMLSGETIDVKFLNKWFELYPKIKIANAYGPTEAADDITQFIVEGPVPENHRVIPIGKPLANLNLYIVDQQMKLLPIGAPGEICVSGIGVGDGYWKNEAKTKLAFVPNPFISKLHIPNNHHRIYKTGDLGRWRTDGNIEFLGRIDHQVKIRGFRIELGEIEACLTQHSNVREAVAIVREDDPGDKRLVAYAVPISKLADDEFASTELIGQLRDLLNEKLPVHMVPSAIVLLEILPLAPSGKINRKALPIPNFQQESKVNFVAPRTPTEEIVVDIWTQVLKHEPIGIHDNFFNLGGHSLLATQVIAKLRRAFEIKLPLRSLFDAPTVAELVEHIEALLTVQQLQPVANEPIDHNLEEIEL
ncbi:MAG: amino acid adenylation domain-containing protein [Cyanobacteria bacterium P01_F01_bin.143]